MDTTKMQLEDWLDDLCVRFIINLPQEDLSSVARICFQVEEAQWFYEDFIRPLDPTLPSMSLRSFCLRIFQHCPLLANFSLENHMRAFEEFLQYKTRVPVRGAILLNEAMDSTILVKGWKKGANWSFPRGKINKDEDDLDCAIREVYEETGFDIRAAGLVPPHDEVKYIEITMREQQMRLYVFRNIPMDTYFEPKTRKEISKIQWYKLSELPAFRKKGNQQNNAAATNANKFYMVAPFLVPLKKWVVSQKKKDAQRGITYGTHLAAQPLLEEALTEDDAGMQTDPTAEAMRITPAIDTLDGATRELQRLLKVQPPTQGLQPSQPSPQDQDKGGALLAMLQRSNGGAGHQPSAQAQQAVPHTPLDLTYTNAPQPVTPHHHHPAQRLPYSSYQQQPPEFPLPPQQHQNAAGFQYHQNYSDPQMRQGYTGPPMAPPPQQRPDPVPLMHPQPLPPQVQKALFNRGVLPSPGVPDAAYGQGQGTAQPHYANQMMNMPQHKPNAGQPHPVMNQHKMALLSAFKSDAPRNDENGAPPPPPPPHNTLRAGQAQAPALNWANPQRSLGMYPASQQMSSQGPPPQATEAVQRLLGNVNHGQQAAARPVQPNDKHRSALLDMFKQPAPASPRGAGLGPAADANARMGSAESQQRASGQLPSGKAIEAEARANGGPIQMNPDLNLPFGALSIMSRAKDAANRERAQGAPAPAPPHQASAPYSPGAASNATVRAGAAPSQQWASSSPNLAQHGAVPLSPQYAGHSAHHHSPSYTQGPHNAQVAPPMHGGAGGTVVRRQSEANPEQKQKLLSLFGKAPAAAAAGPAAEPGFKGKEPSLLDQLHGGGAGRPRMPSSHASAGLESGQGSSANASRRGSQTPISPADRNFLLGYLESMSGSAGR
ncbi:uncharacterized protein E0L32_009547 [Thyridium curvatum]|uniref:Nudix hydrolase domain-containing protein n=1 Tax=Thyridium curvatum TaxID=1093900 RepID=A0A507AVW7_9PEZI|nr:uncharacterized protein E0L32_009547 [Thyridium curvatum]TPX08968.1 hypothetical protein E0L32_009547 [Thyridium curvatum]